MSDESSNSPASESDLRQRWKLLKERDHFEHEEIILFLEFHPDPRSVPHIRDAIKLKKDLQYLAYDDYGAYYKKCLWALQKIGTAEALNLIKECSKSDIPELRKEAEHRLARIERSRKIDR